MNHAESLKTAIVSLRRADHLTYMTLPLVKDSRLIWVILENLYFSAISGMDAVLEYEKMYKPLMPLPDNFEGRFGLFRDKLINKYNITIQEVELIRKLRDMIESHKNSPVEFSRPGKFVICNENYRIRTVSIQDIKEYIVVARGFLGKINNTLK